jgi:hypothetical protein
VHDTEASDLLKALLVAVVVFDLGLESSPMLRVSATMAAYCFAAFSSDPCGAPYVVPLPHRSVSLLSSSMARRAPSSAHLAEALSRSMAVASISP